MSVDENNTSAMIEALFIPVTHYWMDDAIGIGSWILRGDSDLDGRYHVHQNEET
jgi:hypothetical protein